MSTHAWLLLASVPLTVLLLAFLLAGPLARILLPDTAARVLPPVLPQAPALLRRLGGACDRVATAVESSIARLAGIDLTQEMGWAQYTQVLLAFNVLGAVVLYGLQRLQGHLPLNPAGLGAVAPDLAWNTALSFVTNTNWQNYSGETTLSVLTQMAGLTVQNFLSAASGIAVAAVLVRALVRDGAQGVGNAWADLLRITLRLLLPLAGAFALLLAAQGCVQTLAAQVRVNPLEITHYDAPVLDAAGNPVLDAAGQPRTTPAQTASQDLPLGPVASQEAIKILGTNGGGPFNANSAHPFENPTPLTDAAQMVAMLLIPAALVLAFGRLSGDPRQGRAILGTMVVLYLASAGLAMHAEEQGNPRLAMAGVDMASGPDRMGGNPEGKEQRFGPAQSALFATHTTVTSTGATDSLHDALMPLGGAVVLWNMMLGEVVFGGVGSGLYGMLVYALLAVFLAGLMIGRTPEYLGKKVESFDMKMLALAVLVTPLIALGGTAVGVALEAGRAGVANPGAHGFSEILYAFTSTANNNGSAFAGLSGNTRFYNFALGLSMWFGRFAVIVPVIALAGSLAAKRRLPVTAGTLPTHGPLFAVLLGGTVVLVGALNYVPALALGPLAEHFALFPR
jgi:K+-transporting ATPase ATPase A chain